MKLLLDTHLLLWAAGQPDRLPAAARDLTADPRDELLSSAASLWEVALEHGLGGADFRADSRLLRRGLLDNGYRELPVTGGHAVATESLPLIHKDPFDRILVARAIAGPSPCPGHEDRPGRPATGTPAPHPCRAR